MTNNRDLPILLLGTLGPIKYKTRLQKIAFLYDQEVAKKPTYEWSPHRFGPYSRELIDDVELHCTTGLIKKLDVEDSFRGKSIQYALTIRGQKKFREILNKYKISVIRSKFLQYQYHNTNFQLLQYVYNKYPKYTTKSEIKDQVLDNDY